MGNQLSARRDRGIPDNRGPQQKQATEWGEGRHPSDITGAPRTATIDPARTNLLRRIMGGPHNVENLNQPELSAQSAYNLGHLLLKHHAAVARGEDHSPNLDLVRRRQEMPELLGPPPLPASSADSPLPASSDASSNPHVASPDLGLAGGGMAWSQYLPKTPEQWALAGGLGVGVPLAGYGLYNLFRGRGEDDEQKQASEQTAEPYLFPHPQTLNVVHRIMKVASEGGPFSKQASEREEQVRQIDRRACHEAIDAVLDNIAASQPLEKRASVRSLQQSFSKTRNLSTALQKAYKMPKQAAEQTVRQLYPVLHAYLEKAAEILKTKSSESKKS